MSTTPAEKTKSVIETVGAGPESIGLETATQIAGKGRNLNLTFEYLGFLFAVKATSEGGKTNMRVHANLGNVPYTIEGAANRQNTLSILQAAKNRLGGQVVITAEQRILILEEYVFEKPLTPVLLVTETTLLLLKAKPLLELLMRFVTPPAMRRIPAEG